MAKVVINRCHGGFGLSHEAVVRYHELKGNTLIVVTNADKFRGEHDYYIGEQTESMFWYDGMIGDRNDPALVQVVEELGSQANGWAAELAIIEIPDDVKWHIEEYDGLEWVAEDHRTWS